MEEVFRDIEGFEGKYQVSNFGNVKSLERTKKGSFNVPQLVTERILKPSISKSGYYKVALSNDGKFKHLSIHRLIAKHFIPNPESKPQVNHKDGNKLNNAIDNLEWATVKENALHSYHVLRKNQIVMPFGKDNHRSKTVRQYTKKNEFVAEFGSVREACRITGIDHRSISQVAAGSKVRKSAGGFIFKYAA